MTNRLREIRKRFGLSQEEAARRANISLNTWRLIETGARNPSLPVAIRIAKAFGVTIDELFVS